MLTCDHVRMRVVVWNSQKGGSGKTTLCAAVTVEAERAGDGPAFVIDTDPQGTLTTWHEARQAETPARIEAAAALSHHGRVAQTIVPTRVAYPAAMTDGHTAPELPPRGPAAVEIAKLWGDIKACLHASMLPTRGVLTYAQGS